MRRADRLRGVARAGLAAAALALGAPGAEGAARWVPLAAGPPGQYQDRLPDGAVRVIRDGLRAEIHPDGRVDTAAERLPEDAVVGVVELPTRLGGGVLFRAAGRGETDLFRAPRFTGALRPLVRLPFAASDVVAGFDRLLALSERTRGVVGVDPASGAIVGPGRLPAAPAYGSLAFLDAWVGLAEVDLRGVLATFDAGASWHPLAVRGVTPAVSLVDGRLLVATERGTLTVLPGGGVTPLDGAEPPRAATDEGEAPDPSAGGARPLLELLSLRGLPDGAGAAWVARGAEVLRVALDDGRVLARAAAPAFGGATCTALRLGSGAGFACEAPGGGLSLHRLSVGLEVTLVAEFGDARRVAPAGSGPVVVSGGCARVAREGRHCVLGAGAPREVELAPSRGAERVGAFADGTVAIVVPPAPGRTGSLTLLDPRGARRTLPLGARRVPDETRRALERGLWLEGLTDAGGELAAFVAAGSELVGVRITRAGELRAGRRVERLGAAMLSGLHALIPDGQRGLLETRDGGLSWSEASAPELVGVAERGARRGCTAVGCALGSFLRVGWGAAGSDERAAARRPDPDRTPFVTFGLTCHATGAVEDRRSVARRPPAPSATPGAEEPPLPAGVAVTPGEPLESSAFRPFLGWPAPRLAPGEVGFDFGTEEQLVQARAYAWGRPDRRWDRGGRWLVRLVDRFHVRGLATTAVSRPPWEDALTARAAFGSDPSHRVTTDWSFLQDASGDAGIAVQRGAGLARLAVLRAGRPIVTVDAPEGLGLERPLGVAVFPDEAFLAGAPAPGRVEIHRVTRAGVERLADLARVSDDAPARLVRDPRTGALALWVVARGAAGSRSGGDTWYLHVIDRETGEVAPPSVIPREALARAPAPCDPDAEGFLLVHEPPPGVVRVEVPGVDPAPSLGKVEARVLATPRGPCLEAVAARATAPLPGGIQRGAARSARPAALAVPLVVTERDDDRRVEFRCVP